MVFIPTYLYIKQQTITGKLYFGKTCKNPLKYKGSGKHWKLHINQHGNEYITTLWYHLYDNIFDLVADALSISNSLDIVNSKSWLNLMPENGLDGSYGYKQSIEHKTKIRLANIGKTRTIESRKKMSDSHKGQTPWNKSNIKRVKKIRSSFVGDNNPFYGKSHTIESKQLMCNAKKNKPSPNKGKQYKKTKRFDFICPTGIIIESVTINEISCMFNLNKDSLGIQIRRNRPYKGFVAYPI